MKWEIEYLEKDGIVCMETSGPADWEQNRKMCDEALELGRRNGSHKFLVDHRNLEHGLSLLQVDALPGMLKQAGVTAEDKIAVVFDPSSPLSDKFSFFKDVSFIESLQVRLFTDPKEATAWLKSNSTGTPK
jgi:hypothetical protein